MTRNDRRLRRKKPLGIGVFFVFLLVLLNIIGLLAAIVVATPLGDLFLFNAESGFLADMNGYVVPRVQTWLLDAFNMSHSVFGLGETQTAYVYLVALYEAFMLASLFFFFPFFVIGHNRIVNKKGKTWRKAVQAVDILLLLALLVFGVLFLFARHPYYSQYFTSLDEAIYQPYFALFEEGGVLSLFTITVRNNLNPELSGAIFIVACTFLLSFILNIVGLVGKNKYYTTPESQKDKETLYAYARPGMPSTRLATTYGMKVLPIPSAEHFIVQQPPVKPTSGAPAPEANGAPRVQPVLSIPSAERDVPPTDAHPAPVAQAQPELAVPASTDLALKTQPEPIAEVTEETFLMVDRNEPVEAKTEAVPEPEIQPQPEPQPQPEVLPAAAPVATKEPEEPVVEKKAVAPEVPAEEKPEPLWIQPTYREVLILNALDSILPEEAIALPALRETDIPAVLSDLEPFTPAPVANLPEEEKELEEASSKADNIQVNNVPVDYLPGIDDHILAPWEQKEAAKEEVTEVAKPEEVPEVPVETLTPSPAEVQISEETKPVPEETPTEEAAPTVEETKEEQEEAVEEAKPSTPIVATILPDVEEVYVEEKEETEEKAEEPVEEAREETVAVEEVAEEETVAKPTEEKRPAVIAINEVEASALRPQEEDHPENEIVRGASRYDKRVTVNRNDLDERQGTTLDEGWTIPGFVEIPQEKKEEEKIVIVEKVVEVQPISKPAPHEEEKEERKVIVPVAPLQEDDGLAEESKRRFTLVDPMQHQQEEQAPTEEKKLAAVSGPLHQIRERKRDIQLVEPTRVRFDLKAYQIKTYQGELTPEEAFLKGVTKVQPKVNPIFANQAHDDSWKQKKIDEENRKSGFYNVSQGKLVKPTRPLSQKPTNTKITSIRDMVKARKAQNEEEKDDSEK